MFLKYYNKNGVYFTEAFLIIYKKCFKMKLLVYFQFKDKYATGIVITINKINNIILAGDAKKHQNKNISIELIIVFLRTYFLYS